MPPRENNIFFRNSDRFTIIVLVCFSLLLYSFLALTTPRQFTSPDEAANYLFAERWSRSWDPRVPIPVDVVHAEYLHPRSTFAANGFVSPLSFLGFPFFAGMIARMLTPASIVFVTPALATAGVAAFFLLLRKLFSRSFALAGAALLLFHPAYWYNATRSMFHNVGFVALLLVGAAVLVHAIQTQKTKHMVFGGLALGMALSFRTSEAGWVILAGLVLAIQYRSTVLRWRTMFAVLGFLAPFLPILISNTYLYGQPLRFGYAAAVPDAPAGSGAGSSVLDTFFPFGIDVGRSAAVAWVYLGKMFFWLTPFFVLGVIVLAARMVRKQLRQTRLAAIVPWAWVTLVCAVWLILMYGSWDFWEYHGPYEAILGSSYLRYWLPIFVLAIPYILVGMRWLGRTMSPRAPQRFVAGMLAIVALFSWQIVFFAPLYGLKSVRSELVASSSLLATLQRTLPADAVVIAGKADKVLFPTFLVVTEIRFENSDHRRFLRELLVQRPVYLLLNSLDQEKESTLASAKQNNVLLARRSRLSSFQEVYQIEFVTNL